MSGRCRKYPQNRRAVGSPPRAGEGGSDPPLLNSTTRVIAMWGSWQSVGATKLGLIFKKSGGRKLNFSATISWVGFENRFTYVTMGYRKYAGYIQINGGRMNGASRLEASTIRSWIRQLEQLICGESAKPVWDIKVNVVFKASGEYRQLFGYRKLGGFAK